MSRGGAVPLKHLCRTISRGGTPSYSEAESGDALVIGQSCQRPDNSFDLSRARWHTGPIPTKGRVFPEDILINSTGTGTLGRVAQLPSQLGDIPVFADTHVTIVRPDRSRAHPRFLAYVLSLPSFVMRAEEALSVGATKQKELNVEALRAHRVRVLPIRDQGLAADFLDRECERIRDLDDRLNAAAVRTLERFRSELGELVAGLNVTSKRLEDLTDRARPIVYGILMPGPHFPGGVPVIHGGHVETGEIHPQSLPCTTLALDAEFSRSRIRPGDLVMSVRGSFGSVAIIPASLPAGNVSRDAVRIAPSQHVERDWLLWMLRTPQVIGELMQATVGTGVKGLNVRDIRRCLVPAPHRDEQAQLLASIRPRDAHARRLLDRLAEMRRRLAEYRDALITEAVTGQLDLVRVSDSQMDGRAHAALEGATP